MGNKKLPDMPFKKKAMKLLEDLSLDELHEARNCIDDLITERECSGTKRQKESNKAEAFKKAERFGELIFEIMLKTPYQKRLQYYLV